MPDSDHSSSQRRTHAVRDSGVCIPLIFATFIITIVGWLFSPSGLKLFDLPEFYAPGRMLLDGTSSFIYDPDFLIAFEKRLFPCYESPVLYISPLALSLLVPLGLIPLQVVNILWFGLLIFSSVAGLAFSAKVSAMQPRLFLRFALFLCAFAPQFEAIKHGQPAPILFLSLASCLLMARHKRDFLAGICLVPLFAKPHEILPLLLFIAGARRFKLLLGFFSASAFVSAVSLMLFGPGIIASYIQLLSMTEKNRIWMASDAGPTLHGQLLRVFSTSQSVADLLSLIVLALAFVFLLLLGDRVKRINEWWHYLAFAALPIGLVTSLHCHSYDLLLLLPGIVLFVAASEYQQISGKLKLIHLTPLLLYMLPIYIKVHYEYVMRGAVLNPLFFALFYLAIAACVWAWRLSGRKINCVEKQTDLDL